MEKSLWRHRAVAGKLVTDPERGMALARRKLAHRRAVHSDDSADARLDAWGRLLYEGVDAVVEMITAQTEAAVEVRQNTPLRWRADRAGAPERAGRLRRDTSPG
ncbi:hypothetical protein ACPPVO_47445 [Dactylosporangium sp. McL0621]|uniref:hypothetical protein n=1 Tax=Dactylosporangium sp. McL0621 TaxID=3415678 RepID=UPI003CE8DE15